MLEAIEAAQSSVRLETYIYSAGSVGERFLQALVRARQRGAQVRVLYDALGSAGLPNAFFQPLRAVGGEVRLFNPLSINRLGIRDHRKVLVCDEKVAFVGGFNIASEYDGDGVSSGWYDLGLKIVGSIACELALAFDDMFERAAFRHKAFVRLRKSTARKMVVAPHEQLLLSGPGRGRNPIKRALRLDLANAREVKIIMAYFVPTWRVRRGLVQVARRGGDVQFILAGKTDVALARLAGQSLYRRFFKLGIKIFEYQPQILHAKLIIIDDAVYVGSANLDQRSLNINYEVMIRLRSKEMADQAREVFACNLKNSREITLEEWKKSRGLWQRIKQHLAYWVLVRIDPYIAERQWRRLAD